ncbi:hypothetical protein [Pseudobdellovibrio sp. HCB154]|uniref:hypothetical protein n=1 Tax=Pseudobdellovibrio sp. HCB154 TaxID=3386277 RepID=UPI00391734FA
MMALLVIGIVSTGVYFISNKIITERKLSSQLRKDIHANLALRSITDYIKYGIRKGWCFDSQLLPELPQNCVNNFTNQFSTTRIMMPPSYAKTLEELGQTHGTEFPTLVGKKANDFILPSFSIQLDLNNLTMAATHPLYRVLTNTRNPLVKGVNIKVSRINNMTLPVNGDEVYVEIAAEFTGRDGKTVRTGIEVTGEDGQNTATGKQFLREISRFVSNPRELNSFALILPGSIYLGKSVAPVPGHGDMAIPQGSAADIGMVFNSPIFVNQNIFMESSGSYTPATFNDVVIIGNGKIKDHNGSDFKIGEALGVKRYWTDLKTFGGFMRGIDSDGKGDAGLSVLNGVSDSTTLNNDIIEFCINIVRAQGDLNVTKDARLVGEPVSGSVTNDLTETTIRYSFSTLPKALDVFEPQEITKNNGGINCNYNGLNSGNGGISCSGFAGSDFMDLSDKYNNISGKDASNIWYSITPAYNLSSGTSLVMWANMTWPKPGNDDFLKIPLLENGAGDGHTVTINFSAYSKNEYDQAANAMAAVSSTLMGYASATATASATLNTRTVRLSHLETTKPASGGYASWPDRHEYEDLKDNKFNNDSVAWAQDKFDDAKDDYQDYRNGEYTDVETEYLLRKEYYENPGQIQISSIKPDNGYSERQSAFRNVTIKILNGKYFKRANISPTNRIYNTSGSSNDLYKTSSLSNNAIKDFSLEGMDYSAKKGGYSVRPRDWSENITNNPNDGNTGKLADMNNVHYSFSINAANELVFSNRGLDYQGNEINLGTYRPLNPTINYEEKIEQCMDSAGGTNLDAFKPASFASADFTSVAPDSWHFASDYKDVYQDQVFSTNVLSKFDIGSIRNNCIIEPSATVINGFFVCRTLNIKARSQPLRMTGTFMVLKDFIIDKTALKAGVTWQSIHNQTAVATMKSAGSPPLMRRANNTNCSTLYSGGTIPFWHPDPGLQILSDRIRCSSTFVLQGQGPPRWTSVDPDCGRIGSSTNTQCLKRIRNFNLIQLERVYGL